MDGRSQKILFLLTRPPYPANDGTKIKILTNILDAVRGRYDCTIVIVSDVPPNREAVAYLEKHYGRVRYFYRSRLRRVWNAAWGWLCGYPLQAGFFYSAKVSRALRKDFEDADVIYAHTLRFGKYIEALPAPLQKKVLLDFNDAISFNYHIARQYAHGAWKYIYALEEQRVRRYEKKLLLYPFHSSIVSVADRDYLSAPFTNVIEHGVPDELLEYPNGYNGGRAIAFMGNMLYPPNLDSIKWLGKFLERHPFKEIQEFVCDVAGRAPIGLAEQYPNISFAGFVDDPRTFIVEHKLFVAPLRFGAGVQTKVLEAMALGMPVITSPVGARGISGAKNGENIFIVDMGDDAAWVNTIERLLADRSLRVHIGESARELIKGHHTASRARASFLKIMNDIVPGVVSR